MRGRKLVHGRRGFGSLIGGKPRPTSVPGLIENGVLDGFLVTGCAFHLSADPRGPKFAVACCSSCQGIDDMFVPVVQAIRASASAIYAV